MFCFKVLVIILCLRISIASKKCTKIESCYDEAEENRILANPFLQEKFGINATDSRENSNAHDSSDQHHSEGKHPACPNTDICQLMCLHNILNLTGPKASTGKRGSTGKPGPPGPVGPSGTNTSTLQGCKIQGVIKGLQGDPGFKGEPGIIGLEGAPGLTGESGTPGLKGDTGLKGEPAEGGVFGPVGPAGPPGRDGLPGEKGDTGDIGYCESGVRGLRGRPGLRGDRGAPGALIIFMPSDQNLTDPQIQILNNYDDVSTILQRMVEGTGDKNNPVRTCSDLPYINNGGLRSTIWIDPNGGDISDAIKVSCHLERGTCIEPIERRSKNISFDGTQEAFDNSVWLSEINGGMQISYGDINHQIGFLQLQSDVVSQDIAIHCQNTVVYYDNSTSDYSKAVKLMTWNDVVLFAKTGHPDHRYKNLDDNCSTSSFEWGKTTLQYKTDKAMRLPIMDVAILDYGVNKSFSVELGPVCFRSIESSDTFGKQDTPRKINLIRN